MGFSAVTEGETVDDDDDDDGVNGEIIYLQAKHPPPSLPSSLLYLPPESQRGQQAKLVFWAETEQREREGSSENQLKTAVS